MVVYYDRVGVASVRLQKRDSFGDRCSYFYFF
jgi:hypothetical protein